MKRKVLLYETEDKKCFIKDFILSLDNKVRREIIKIFKLMQEVEILAEPYFKKLTNTNGIWEIRKRFGTNSYRVLFFFDDDNIVLLTNGFIKKTQKTPKIEIEKAEKLKNDYFRRKK